ncbi:hypothetical protein CCAX7_28560 [Capsulimonas corticalis]|uniref:Uncharacterized protein n=1 Tax=Capsulimonas corticalis TaxID=2219043 RepID=A0A402CTA9_9BACT|nr:hypothetical protein [Capsulimonas corticalis]BDI30805.1 hypothetical protein CCAX7_28560 [Capsulimonas corticalis]
MGYSIWIEFEQYNPAAETDEDGFCNIEVTWDDGRHKGYNVWTAVFFRDNIETLLDEVQKDGFAIGPDIIVSRLTREHITEVLKKMLSQDAAASI